MKTAIGHRPKRNGLLRRRFSDKEGFLSFNLEALHLILEEVAGNEAGRLEHLWESVGAPRASTRRRYGAGPAEGGRIFLVLSSLIVGVRLRRDLDTGSATLLKVFSSCMDGL